MEKVSEFYSHATNFRMMAKRSESPAQEIMLDKWADTWESLAKERAALVARQQGHIERR